MRPNFVLCQKFKWILQNADNRFVSEFATFIFFVDILCCFGDCERIAKAMYCRNSFKNKYSVVLWNPEQTAILTRCGDKINTPSHFTLTYFVRGNYGSFVSGIHLHFGKCLKTCLWFPVTYRQKNIGQSKSLKIHKKL